MASSTPFLTPSRSSKSPTTSLAAYGLNSSSPPVFSLIVLHHALKVARPTPAGHDVGTLRVVVAAPEGGMNGAPVMVAAPAVAAAAVRNRRRDVFLPASMSSSSLGLDISLPDGS